MNRLPGKSSSVSFVGDVPAATCPEAPSLWPSRIGGFVVGGAVTFVAGMVLLSLGQKDLEQAFVDKRRWRDAGVSFLGVTP